MQFIVFDSEYVHDLSFADLRRVLGNRSQNRLDVTGRTGNHPQDVADCRLLLQRFRKVSRLRLHLVEQPRILDRDHSLIGECLNERQLPFRVPESGLRVGKDDRADALFPIDQRRESDRSKTTRGGGVARKLGRVGSRDIGNFDDTTFENCPCGRCAVPIERNRIYVRTRSTSKPEIEAAVASQYSLSSFRVVIVAEQGSNSFAALLTIASNTGCTSDRRTGDDLQYLGRRRLLLAGFLQVFARTGDRTTLNSGGRWRNAALGLGGLAALCWACVAGFRLARLAARS